MATPALVVVVLVLVATIAALAVVLLLLVRHLAGVARDLADLQEQLAPVLEELQRDAAVTGRELERVSASLAEGRRGRDPSR